MRSDYIDPHDLDHILAALMPQNELAMRISLATGLRIDDVLSLKTEQIRKARTTVKEMKTGKTRRVYIPEGLRDRALKSAGRYYVFEGRSNAKRHRTRQAVYKDLKRAAKLFRVPVALQISPHTARKVYAIEAFKKFGNPEKIRQLLNHSDPATTALYLMAEAVYARKMAKKKPAQKTPK